jgi:hypothetical protein
MSCDVVVEVGMFDPSGSAESVVTNAVLLTEEPGAHRGGVDGPAELVRRF